MAKVQHEIRCHNNPDRLEPSEKWKTLMKNRGIFHKGENQFTKARRLGLPIPQSKCLGRHPQGRPHTEEEKKKISEARKKYLREHPEKCHWRNKDKFKSVPCEKLKEILRKDYSFVEEYTDTRWEHNYSLDIAFLEKKLAIEVNGEQHYDKTGNLAPYYQKRHEYLTSQGWTVIELHYANCFNQESIEKIKTAIETGIPISEEEHKLLFQNKRKSKEEKRLLKFAEFEKAKREGRLDKTQTKIIAGKYSEEKWIERKNKILSCGVDITKYGWAKLVSDKIGLSRGEIYHTILHFPNDFANRFKKLNAAK